MHVRVYKPGILHLTILDTFFRGSDFGSQLHLIAGGSMSSQIIRKRLHEIPVVGLLLTKHRARRSVLSSSSYLANQMASDIDHG
ncbi:hypothetical protein TNCV_4330571 [Trichonephila clavipes]|nr:hypothetical protein TNCV_4330571 [Trichonephila clavipes]